MKPLKTIAVAGLIGAGIATAATIATNLPARAQSCVPLAVVEGQGSTTVRKAVSAPSTGITHSNWNTDFAVPSGQSFNHFIAQVTSAGGGEFDIHMYLKYSNDTADEVFNQSIDLPAGREYSIRGSSRRNATPYQVNLSVGGLQAVGKSYSLAVFGCN